VGHRGRRRPRCEHHAICNWRRQKEIHAGLPLRAALGGIVEPVGIDRVVEAFNLSGA
jgi:hypothetical protein